jgi:hypothetical protein
MKFVVKNICKACGLFAVALSTLVACDDKNYGGEEYPPVGYSNMAGSWKMSVLEGKSLEGNVYAYMRMERRMIEDSDVGWRAFQTYSTLSTAQPIEKTGRYILKTDDLGRTMVEGQYDDFGYWQKDFYYVSMRDADTMVWTANDDPENVTVYNRVEASVLDEIISQIHD